MTGPSGTALARTTLAALKGRITSGTWPVGSRIPTEPELATELGVGRSTIREAVRSLASLGMVETLRARGTFVRSTTPAPSILLDAVSIYSPAELLGARRALDVESAQAAAARRTDAELATLEAALDRDLAQAREALDPAAAGIRCSRFHDAIAGASGNRLIAELAASLSVALEASGLDRTIAGSLDPAVLVEEHDRIFSAIRAKDVGEAAHRMAMHLDSMLRGIAHEPIVTDLTTLVRVARRTGAA